MLSSVLEVKSARARGLCAASTAPAEVGDLTAVVLKLEGPPITAQSPVKKKRIAGEHDYGEQENAGFIHRITTIEKPTSKTRDWFFPSRSVRHRAIGLF